MMVCLTVMRIYYGKFFYFIFIVNEFTHLLKIKKKQNIE